MNDTTGNLEMSLFKKRPDLWALSKALKLAPDYKAKLWELLSDKDRDSLLAYSAKLRAINAGTQGNKR